ncbi:type I-E CRISPR-associated protein Cse2/CasB [Kitasatospora sp. NPDC006697]|uniref:type I-E CRISPR-associated protein Cse2/CasB n=1 Tax=Kitasatospora sp. NPDC006697 TaxID=3364020 RepID=UPI003698DE55
MSDTSAGSHEPATGLQLPSGEGSLAHARAFVRTIDKRCHSDPGVRSALRRGVGRSLDEVPFMHRYVASWLTAEQFRNPEAQRAYYAVASLIADQRRDQYTSANESAGADSEQPADGASGPTPDSGQADGAAPKRRYGTSLGSAFAAAVRKGDDGIRESSAETRLNQLTRQSANGLHRHLPGAIRQLRSRNIDVDYAQLLVDLIGWPRYSGSIKRRWLQDYYRTIQPRPTDGPSPDQVPEAAEKA